MVVVNTIVYHYLVRYFFIAADVILRGRLYLYPFARSFKDHLPFLWSFQEKKQHEVCFIDTLLHDSRFRPLLRYYYC